VRVANRFKDGRNAAEALAAQQARDRLLKLKSQCVPVRYSAQFGSSALNIEYKRWLKSSGLND
jgi:hypothetical protein